MVEHIVAHGKEDDGKDIVRIRWYGYDITADTWEQTEGILPHFVKRYCTRKKIPASSLLPKGLVDAPPTRRILSTVQDDDLTANPTALLFMEGETLEKLELAACDHERARRTENAQATAVVINGLSDQARRRK